MPAAQRSPGAGVIQGLFDAPGRFGLFAALRLLERWLGTLDLTLAEQVRFHNSLATAFPPGEVAALWSGSGDHQEIVSAAELWQALRAQPRQAISIHIMPACIGLLGHHGAMPDHYTQSIADAERQRHDAGPRALLDLLSNRACLQFYQAWATHRIECQADAVDNFLSLQLALAGVWPPAPLPPGAPADTDPDCLSDEAIAHYALRFRQRPVTADVIEATLAEYFEIPLRLRQFVGDWYARDDRALLGVSDCVLGGGTMLGERCHRNDLAAEIELGPLSLEQYRRFLPGSGAVKAITHMLTLFGVRNLRYRLRLILRGTQTTPARLGGGFATDFAAAGDGAGLGQGLGQGLFLGCPGARDSDDLHFDIGEDAGIA